MGKKENDAQKQKAILIPATKKEVDELLKKGFKEYYEVLKALADK